jgi:hypothetical protein
MRKLAVSYPVTINVTSAWTSYRHFWVNASTKGRLGFGFNVHFSGLLVIVSGWRDISNPENSPHLPHFPRVVTGVSRLKAVFLSIPHEEFEED